MIDTIKNRDEYWRVVDQKARFYLDYRIQKRGKKVYPKTTDLFEKELLPALKTILIKRYPQKNVSNLWLLDVGCGYGSQSFFFSNHGFNVIGVDFSEKGIQLAEKEKFKNAQNQINPPKTIFLRNDIMILNQQAFKIHNGDGKFQVILLYKFLHQLRPSFLETFAKHILSLLHKNGVIVIGTMAKSHPLYKKGIKIEENVYDLRGFRPCHYFDKEDLEAKFCPELTSFWTKTLTEKERSYENDPEGKKYTSVMLFSIMERLKDIR